MTNPTENQFSVNCGASKSNFLPVVVVGGVTKRAKIAVPFLGAIVVSSVLAGAASLCDLYTSQSMVTNGLVGSYVNTNLGSRLVQDDWRISQTISGTRVDPEISFVTNDWGNRVSLGITGGSDANWDNFSVQWDGYVRILTNGVALATESDDSSRMWIDVNHDGSFDSTGDEFIDNHWGIPQAITLGPYSIPLGAGFYRIRLQYEESYWGNQMRLMAKLKPIPDVSQPTFRCAYVVPSNRTPQTNAVLFLRNAVVFWQAWWRDQMERYGFGSKTFIYETEADQRTPKVHVVYVSETDADLRTDLWGRVLGAASNVGLPLFESKNVWCLFAETHIQSLDGSITGGAALGTGYGSGNSGGVALLGSDMIPRLNPAFLTNDTRYQGLVIPEFGPFPLVQDRSFPWFEGTTLSEISSVALGAPAHEIGHAFGLPHDSRDDDNFFGTLMGNGERGMRGNIFPARYTNDYVRLTYAAALALNRSRFFNAETQFPDNTAATVTIVSSNVQNPTGGLISVRFTATDASGMAAAWLVKQGGIIGELPMAGTNITTNFQTAYFDAAQTNQFTVVVFDQAGNRSDANAPIFVNAGFNAAPRPSVRLRPASILVGASVTADASKSSDPNDSPSTLKVAWDIDGDGIIDTVPSYAKALTTNYARPGNYLVRAYVTDPSGATGVGTLIDVKAYEPRLKSSLGPEGISITWPVWMAGLRLATQGNLIGQPWIPAPMTPDVLGMTHRVVWSPTNSQGYFRLQP